MEKAIRTVPSASHQEDTWPLYARISWKVIPILFLVQVFGYLDRANVGFAKLQMQSDLALSNAAYGLGAGIFFIGYFLFEIPANLMLNRVGAKAWFARILITWGLATIAMAFVKDQTWFYILRFIIGAAEAGFAPGSQLYLSQWFPAKYRGRINALYLLSLPVGLALGGPIAGIIMGNLHQVHNYAGWQWLFIIEGIVSVAIAPYLLIKLPNKVNDARWLNDQEKHTVNQDVAHLAREADVHNWRLIFTFNTLGLTTIYFLLLCGNYGVGFWLPQIIKNSGITNAMTIGWLSAVPYLMAALCMPVIGKLSDRASNRSHYLTLCGLMSTIGLVLSAYSIKDTTIALLGFSLVASGVLSFIPVFWAVVSRRFAGSAASVGFASINSIGNLAGFVSPFLIGIVTDRTGSQVAGLYTLGVMAALAVLITARFIKETKR